MRKFFITSIAILGTIAALLGAAFLFREDLARVAAARFLDGGQLTLSQLQGLQISPTQLKIAELQFLLHATGQELRIADLQVDFRVNSLRRAPQVEALTIGSAQLSAATSASASGEPDLANVAEDSADPGPQLSEVLALLRNFPLARVAVNELRIPQRRATLAFDLQSGAGALATTIASGELHLQAQFQQADATVAARFTLNLTQGGARVAAVDLSLQPQDDNYAIAGSGRLDIADLATLLDELEQAGLPLSAAQLDWELSGTLADDLRGSLTNAEAESFVLGVQAGSTLRLPAELGAGLDAVDIEFSERADLVVTSGAGLRISSVRVPVRVASRWQDQALSIVGALALNDCALATNAACSIGFDGNAALGTHALSGAIRFVTGAPGAYRIETQGLALSDLPGWLPAFDLGADLTISDETVSLRSPLLLRNVPANAGIALEGSYERASGAVNLHATLPELTFSESGTALSAWFNAWPHAYDLLTGSVAAELDLRWQAELVTGSVSASLDDLGGFYGDYFFRGMSGELQGLVDTAATFPVETPPLTLTLAALDVGLPMTNLRLDFRLDHAGLLEIASFSTELLDGTISGNDIRYDFARERNELRVRFSGLRIERMLDLVEYQGIEAIGAVSGEIPLTLTPNGVEVADGVLAADAPGGSIRYRAATGNTGNAGFDLVNQALGNYQFESLTSGIEYTPDGELLLDMKLQGHNPDMQNGQRINLNLNLSDNVPALLESLQAARRIEDFLELQYR